MTAMISLEGMPIFLTACWREFCSTFSLQNKTKFYSLKRAQYFTFNCILENDYFLLIQKII